MKRQAVSPPLALILTSAQAFAPKSGRRADKQARRNVERDQTRLHVPLVNRTPDDEPPPVIVAIVGPPGVSNTAVYTTTIYMRRVGWKDDSPEKSSETIYEALAKRDKRARHRR
jgi:ribosome biogenesis protein BMS1